MVKKQEDFSTFFLSFMGQQVIITTDLMTTETVSIPEQGIEQNTTYPLFYEGILLDEDPDFLYLGQNPDEVFQAVSKKHVLQIMVHEEIDMLNTILDQLETPDPDKQN